MSRVSTRVCQHLRSAGLTGTAAARLASLTQKWVDKSGLEWAAERWKSLGLYAHQRLINPNTPIPIGWACRISRRSGRRILRDGDLHRMLELGESPSPTQLRVLEAIVRIPTALYAENPKPTKIVKALEGIIQPSRGRTSVLPVNSIDHFFMQYLPNEVWTDGHRYDEYRKSVRAREEAIPLRYTPASSKSSPFYTEESLQEHKLLFGSRKDIRTISPMFFFNDRDAAQLYLNDPKYFSEVFYGHPDAWLYSDICSLEPDELQELPIGRVSLLNKDGKAKIRCIFSPLMEVQAAMDPLKRVLSRILRAIPASGVHDQEAAKLKVAKWLSEGRYCAGFDQSSFTDRFPYKLQRQVLGQAMSTWWNTAIKDMDLKILDLCVQRPWVVPQIDETQNFAVRFSVGQPMGLNPSFALATLSHIVAVYHCWINADHKYPFEDTCRVVGDDIVICDDRVASHYEMLMSDLLGVTINRSKSLISTAYTEFCGKIISKWGEIPAVKYREIRDAAGLAEKLSFYGENSQPFFLSLLKKFPEVLMPKPLGLGIKPKDTSYRKWIKPFAEEAGIRSINHDISDFVGVSRVNEHLLKRLSDWDETNPSLISLGESRLLASLDATDRTTRVGQRLGPAPFRDVVDNATRDSIRKDSGIVHPDYRMYVTEQGYIDPRQKAASANWGSDCHPEETDNHPGQPLHVSDDTKTRAVQRLKEMQNESSSDYNSDGPLDITSDADVFTGEQISEEDEAEGRRFTP